MRGPSKEEAVDEYGEALHAWEEVPKEVTDVHEYAITYAADRLNGRGAW